jgi:hypothetical protein
MFQIDWKGSPIDLHRDTSIMRLEHLSPFFHLGGLCTQLPAVTDRARFIVYLVFGFGTTISKHVQCLPSCASSGFMN